jgi:hypothetical protein
MPFTADLHELNLRFYFLFEELDAILDGLQDIKLVLELEEEFSILLSPNPLVFDPLRTYGKYSS